MKWKVHQMDVKTTFLNGVVEEEVYAEYPLGFETHDRDMNVWKLKKAFYSLKQEAETWYITINGFMMHLGFTKSKVDSNLYFKVGYGRPVMILLYVDDLFLIGKEELIKDARMRLAIELKMKYLGIMHYFLGMEVWKNANEISLG